MRWEKTIRIMKKHIWLVLLAQFLLSTCFGQSFDFHSVSPFGIKIINDDSSRSAMKIMFTDYNDDGDYDLLISGLDYIDDVDTIRWENIHYFLEIQENIGDKWNPQFAQRTPVSENFPFPLGFFFPTAGDLNNDGMTDFIVSANVDFIGNRTSSYLKNLGGADPAFEITLLDSMGLDAFVPESFFFPELMDLDLDGDLDLMMSGFNPAFGEENGPDVPRYYYAKNIGTSTVPEFIGWYSNPYGLEPNPLTEVLTNGDIDNDGDMDLLGFTNLIPEDSISYLYFHENTPGPDLKPFFNNVLESPFGLPVVTGEEQFLFPNLVDIDGDGDLDLFVFHSIAGNTELRYYENNLCMGESQDLAVTICEGDAFVLEGTSYTVAGMYTINLEGSDGCDSTILLTLDIAPIANVDLFETICEGESFTIGNETFTDAGDYTVYIVAANGCDSIVYLSLTVDDVDNEVTVSQNTITAHQTGATYQWFDCDSGENIPGAVGQTFVATTSGNYAVNITDVSGCTAVSTCVAVVITATVDELLSNEVIIFPNPGDGLISLHNKTRFPITNLTLMTTSGQLIEMLQYD